MSKQVCDRIPAKISSSRRPRLQRFCGETIYLGEREISAPTGNAGDLTSCGEVLLLELLSRDARQADYRPIWWSSALSGGEGKILMTEFSLDVNVALRLDYSCLFNGDFSGIIAPFFGMQILSLASKCGVLLVPLPLNEIDRLRKRMSEAEEWMLDIDLTTQTISAQGDTRVQFETAPRHRERLLNGMDDTDEIASLKEARQSFRQADKKRRPWLYPKDS